MIDRINHFAPCVTRLKIIFYSLSIFLYFVSSVLGFDQLKGFLSLCAIVSVVISVHSAGYLAITLSSLFLMIGIVCLWKAGVSAHVYLTSFGGMINLLALFTIIPLLAIPIRIGGYGDVIRTFMESKIKSPFHLYRSISLFSFFLSSFLNLAALPLMYYSVKKTVDTLPIHQPTRYASLGIIHGYALPILWTPIAPIVGIVFDITHVRWSSIFPYLFLLSIVGLLLDWGLYRLNRQRIEHASICAAEPQTIRELSAAKVTTDLPLPAWKPKFFQMGFAVLSFISLTMIIEHYLSIGLIGTVIILTIPFAYIWSLLIGQGKIFGRELKAHFHTQLPKMSDQFMVFISAGFLVAAIQSTDNHVLINQLIMNVDHRVGPHFFLILLPFIPLLLAFVGMHPALAISLIAESLDPLSLGLAPETLAIALLGGAVCTFMLGPFNATLGVMSSITNTSSLRIMTWNIGFTAVFIGFITLVLFFIS
jgi:hypothetical protein